MKPTSVRRTVLIHLGVYLLLGLAAGVIWWLVTPVPHYAVADGQVSMDSVQLMTRVDADVSYILIAAVIGLISGALLSLPRRSNQVISLVAIAVGSSVAGLVMWKFGELLSPDNLQAMASKLEAGQELPIPLRLQAKSALLSFPAGALFAANAVLWVRRPPDEDEQFETEAPVVVD
jgi:hypothetical protein